jgi:hypothetical protein
MMKRIAEIWNGFNPLDVKTFGFTRGHPFRIPAYCFPLIRSSKVLKAALAPSPMEIIICL